jgi:probable HAF family extracellular repeat protein
MRDLGTVAVGEHSSAAAINGRGQIVGLATTKSEAEHAFLWQDGV